MKKILKLSLATIPAFIGIGAATSVGVIFSNKNTELNKKYTLLNQAIDKEDKNPFIQEAVSKSLIHSKELLENLQTQITTRSQTTSQSIQTISEKLQELSLKVTAIENQIQSNQTELEKAHQEELRLTQEIEEAKVTHTETEHVAQLATVRAEAHQKAWLQDSLIKQLQTQLEESLKEKHLLEEKLSQAQIEHEHLIHESQVEIETYKTKIASLTEQIEQFKNVAPTNQVQTLYEDASSKVDELNEKLEILLSSNEVINFVNNPSIILNWDKPEASKSNQDFMNTLFGEKTSLSGSDLEVRDKKIEIFIGISTAIFDLLQDKVSMSHEASIWDYTQAAIYKAVDEAQKQNNLSGDDLIYAYSPKVIMFLVRVLLVYM